MGITILDGPMGTQLLARGVATPLPGWSAHALETHPGVVSAIHRDYARAGAKVHTADTFRTRRRQFPDRWRELTRLAVTLAREAVPANHRVAGSIAPIEDCYRPDLSPADPRPEHREMARALAEAGADVLLCETFPNVEEAEVAVEEAVATGVETWASFTAGPDADLLTPDQVREGAKRVAALGASAVMVNCIPAVKMLPYVEAIADVGVAVGAYANAGSVDDRMGWRSEPGRAERYATLARTWVEAGATIIGGCCGTGPEHVAALADHLC
jgi:S-methylmethionine-dependent homocysteine/selenocysteine methylase